MAKAFVIRNDLLIEDQDNPVRVLAAYANATSVAKDLHGVQCAVITVADNLIYQEQDGVRQLLRNNWRDDYKPVVNAEAESRITTAFPEFRQRNYLAAIQGYITQYGADPASWPPEAQANKIEYDRGWQYVSDVRSAANAWTAMPTDPTADNIWPPVITPVPSITP